MFCVWRIEYPYILAFWSANTVGWVKKEPCKIKALFRISNKSYMHTQNLSQRKKRLENDNKIYNFAF